MNIPIFNQPVKPKASITIILDDTNRIGMKATSLNIITNLGMLDMAKHMLLNGNKINVKNNQESQESYGKENCKQD